MRRIVTLLGAGLLLASCAVSHATDFIWQNGGGGSWTITGNWSPATGSATGTTTNDIVDFSQVGITAPITLDDNQAAGQMIFGNNTTSTTINPGSSSANMLLLGGASPSMTVENNGTTTATAEIGTPFTNGNPGGGAFTLVKNGPGTLIFSNNTPGFPANTTSLTINSGTVTVGQAVGSSSGLSYNIPTLTLAGNGTFNSGLSGSYTADLINLAVNPGVTATINESQRTYIGAAGTTSGTVSINGNLTLTVPAIVSSANPPTRDWVNGAWASSTGTITITGTGTTSALAAMFAGPGSSNPGNFDGGWGNVALTLNSSSAGVNSITLGGYNHSYAGVWNIGSLSGTSDATLTQFNNGANTYVVGNLNSNTTFNGHVSGYVNLTKVGTGSLTLGGSNNMTAPGGVIVSNGALYGATGGYLYAPSVVIEDGATNGVVVNSQGGVWTATNLTFGTTNSITNTYLEFFYGGTTPSTSVAPIYASELTIDSSNLVIDVYDGNWTPGVYPLIQYTNPVVGNISIFGTNSTTTDSFGALALTTGTLPQRLTATISNDAVNGFIDLVVSSVAEPIHWTAGTGTWDIETTANWADANGTATTYQQQLGLGDQVLFNDLSAGPSPVTINLASTVFPTGLVFSNNTKNYILQAAGSTGIAGSVGLTKTGSGTLTVTTYNTFTGGVSVLGGILNFQTLASLGTGPISISGGTLQYASGYNTDISSTTVTFGTGGAAIDTGANTVSYANPVGHGGLGGLTKVGVGSLTLSGINPYYGPTAVNNGTLILSSTASIPDSSSIYVASGAILDASSATAGLSLNANARQILYGNGSINGEVTNNQQTIISPGTNGVYGALSFGNDLFLNGGTVFMDVSRTNRDAISVVGNLTIFPGSTVQVNVEGTLTNGTYPLMTCSGSLISGTGSGDPAGNITVTGTPLPSQLLSVSDSITTNEIDLVVASASDNALTWQGDAQTNAWDVATTSNFLFHGSPYTFHQGDTVTFNDNGSYSPYIDLTTALYPTSLTFNVTNAQYVLNDGTGNGSGKISGFASISVNGPNTLIVQAIDNNTGMMSISAASTVQIGNNGTPGDIGPGPITDNGSLVFYQPDNRNASGAISGTGTLTQEGASTLTLLGTNTYTGGTTISSGTLSVGNGGPGSTLGSGPVTDNATLLISLSTPFNLNNSITGSGALVLDSSGKTTLGISNEYDGNTFISNGLVQLSASEEIPDGTTVSGSTGLLIMPNSTVSAGTLDLAGHNETINALSAGTAVGAGIGEAFSAIITNSARAHATNSFVIGDSSDSTEFDGIITDNPNGSRTMLIKTNSDTFTFGGVCSYGGGTLLWGGELDLRATGFIPGSILCTNSVTFNLQNHGGTGVFCNNTFILSPNCSLALDSGSLGNGYTGAFTGSSNSFINVTEPTVSLEGNMELNPFSGLFTIESGGTVRFTTSPNGGTNTLFDLEGYLETKNAAVITLGALEGSAGTIGTPTTAGQIATWVIGSADTNTTFSGTLTGTNNLIKNGTASLTLNGTYAFTGSTSVTNGRLILQDPAVLDTSTAISVISPGILDVSGLTSESETLDLGNSTNQTLSGNGIIDGSVSEGLTGRITPGTSTAATGVGILTVTNTITLSGTNVFKLNRTNALTSDRLVSHAATSPAITVNSSAVLIVTNNGPTNLSPGDTFTLFSPPPSAQFTTIVLPTLTPYACGNPLIWVTDNLPIDGTISIVGTNCNPSNIVFTVSPTTVKLSWPSDHKGWSLQAQTNAFGKGLNTNSSAWYPFPGTSTTNSFTVPVVSTNGSVYYRLTLSSNLIE